jgi:hypothetical protein
VELSRGDIKILFSSHELPLTFGISHGFLSLCLGFDYHGKSFFAGWTEKTIVPRLGDTVGVNPIALAVGAVHAMPLTWADLFYRQIGLLEDLVNPLAGNGEHIPDRRQGFAGLD